MTPRRRSRSVRAGTGVLSLRIGTRQELVAVKNKFSTSTASDIITSHVIRRDDASPECCVSTCKIKKTKNTAAADRCGFISVQVLSSSSVERDQPDGFWPLCSHFVQALGQLILLLRRWRSKKSVFRNGEMSEEMIPNILEGLCHRIWTWLQVSWNPAPPTHCVDHHHNNRGKQSSPIPDQTEMVSGDVLMF